MCITLDRSSGRSLGCRVGKDCVRLHITNIEESGLVPDWNENNPDLVIETGDIIVKVNGVENDSSEMARECQKEQRLDLRILKGSGALTG